MNKKIIAAAIAAAMVAPAAFAGDVTVYGKVRQSIDVIDRGTTDNIQINNHASRLGFKGAEDLGNGMKAVFKMEFGVGISAGQTDEFRPNAPISARNAFVGLAGDFGTVVLGRHDTPLKMSTGSLDLFGDTVGDNNKDYTEALTDRRADGTLAYITPTFGGFHAAIALVPGENNDADGIADAYSVALIYKNAGLHVSLATEQADSAIDALGGAGATGIDLDQWRLGLGYTMDNIRLTAVYEEMEVGSVIDFKTWTIGGKYTMGNNAIKVKYFDSEEDTTGLDQDGWALGLEHNFSKRTQAQLVYVDTDSDLASEDGNVFSIQLNHNF